MAEIHKSAELCDGLCDHVLPYQKFARWVQMFKRGRVSTAVQHEWHRFTGQIMPVVFTALPIIGNKL